MKNIAQLTSSGLNMGTTLTSSGLKNATWLGKEVSIALSKGLSRAAGIAATAWSATSPLLARIAVAASTPQGLLVGGVLIGVIALSIHLSRKASADASKRANDEAIAQRKIDEAAAVAATAAHAEIQNAPANPVNKIIRMIAAEIEPKTEEIEQKFRQKLYASHFIREGKQGFVKYITNRKLTLDEIFKRTKDAFDNLKVGKVPEHAFDNPYATHIEKTASNTYALNEYTGLSERYQSTNLYAELIKIGLDLNYNKPKKEYKNFERSSLQFYLSNLFAASKKLELRKEVYKNLKDQFSEIEELPDDKRQGQITAFIILSDLLNLIQEMNKKDETVKVASAL